MDDRTGPKASPFDAAVPPAVVALWEPPPPFRPTNRKTAARLAATATPAPHAMRSETGDGRRRGRFAARSLHAPGRTVCIGVSGVALGSHPRPSPTSPGA